MIDKEWGSNWEEFSKMDGKPYFVLPKATHDYFLIMVYAVWLPNKSDITPWCSNLIHKHNFTQYWQTKSSDTDSFH